MATAVQEMDTQEYATLNTSVGKALRILEVLGDKGDPVGVSAIARAADLPKSTVFRLLSLMEQGRYVERVGQQWRLGRQLFELGNVVAFCQPEHLRDLAIPYLLDLYKVSQQTVHLALLDDTDVVYLEKVFGHSTMPLPTRVGGRLPATVCALGKAMLTFTDADILTEALTEQLQARTPHSIVVPNVMMEELRRTRDTGVAFDREESVLGIHCVAAPIRGDDGRSVAAISVTGPVGNFDVDAFARPVRRAASAVSELVRTRLTRTR